LFWLDLSFSHLAQKIFTAGLADTIDVGRSDASDQFGNWVKVSLSTNHPAKCSLWLSNISKGRGGPDLLKASGIPSILLWKSNTHGRDAFGLYPIGLGSEKLSFDVVYVNKTVPELQIATPGQSYRAAPELRLPPGIYYITIESAGINCTSGKREMEVQYKEDKSVVSEWISKE
jgi:hypothetical protein